MILSTRPLQAQTSKHLPIYDSQDKFLYGEVRLEGGASPPGLVAVEGICGGVAYPIGFADTQGNFRIPLISGGPRFMSNSGPRFDNEHQFTAELILRDFSFLSNCQFRAQLPGFRSQRVAPRWLKGMRGVSTIIPVGTIVLRPPPPDKTHGLPRNDSDMSRSARSAYKRGGAAMASGRWKDAKTEFQKAVSLEPAYFTAWIGIGLAEEALQNWSAAEVAYKTAFGISPNSAEPYLRIARVGAKTDKWKQAAEYSESALSLDPHNLPEAYSLCAIANFKLGRMDIAESSARGGLRIETADDYPELWLIMALTEANDKRYAEASRSLHRYIALVPKAEDFREMRAELRELQSHLADK